MIEKYNYVDSFRMLLGYVLGRDEKANFRKDLFWARKVTGYGSPKFHRLQHNVK